MTARAVETAIVILLPSNTVSPINDIRKVYDRAYPRWMPHINLIYPFVNEFDFHKEQQKIAKHISDITPFTISLTKESFGYFTHGRSSTIWVKPVICCDAQEGSTVTEAPQVAAASPVQPAASPVQPAASPVQPVAMTTVKEPRKVMKTVKRMVKKIVPYEVNANGKQQPSAPTVIGYPNPNPFNYPVTSDLNALSNAMWSDNCIELKRNPAREYGLDLLRYAIWGLEQNAKNIYPEIGGVQKIQQKVYSPYDGDQFLRPEYYSGVTKKEIEYREEWEEIEEQIEVEEIAEEQIEGHGTNNMEGNFETALSFGNFGMEENSGWEDDGFTIVTKKQRKNKENKKDMENVPLNQNTAVTSQKVINLQRKLYEMYPGDQTDRVNKDSNPHLTLGQCKTLNVSATIEKWKQKWEDITFEVEAIHLISRRGPVDNFVIRKTVPFNVLSTED